MAVSVRPSALGCEVFLQPVDVVIAIGDVNVADEFAEQRQRRVDAVHHEFIQRAAQAQSCILPLLRTRCTISLPIRLSSIGRDLVAGIEPRIDADAEGRPGVWKCVNRDRVRARSLCSRGSSALDAGGGGHSIACPSISLTFPPGARKSPSGATRCGSGRCTSS